MSLLHNIFSAGFLFVSLTCCILGLKKSKSGNTNTETPQLFFIGAFVWADVVVLGLFWSLVSVVVLILQDWLLFWLVVSVFWVVRSAGEVFYWLNQQFSSQERNPPQKFWLFKFFPNDSVWFVIQVYWQCLLVVSIIASVYLFSIWLK
ncbi:MAG: hypothetical protein XD95_0566 [Microgenomates bacterium 39_7]|nr:MAG: hypothetical protein XD95_0566 [Microgenomates bacterium 39_7]